jgi:peptidyl-prolyl cis-trans isomerase B (cyclophilin B)
VRLPLIVVITCLLLGGIASCGGDDKQDAGGGSGTTAQSTSTPEDTGEATPTPEDTGGEQEGCPAAEQPPPKQIKVPKPDEQLDPAKTYVATVKTSCGTFEITLDAKRAPKTGGSFKYLADKGFYDGLGFHRIVKGFVIQGGDPLGTGAGGPGYKIVEAPPKRLAYTKGVVAMAKTSTDPSGASGSQFFVVTGEDAQLPAQYALVGKVTAGQDVVDMIGVEPVGVNDEPATPIVIESIKVAES